ncbi:MAG: hypothetical protein ABJO36_03930 [Litorimonas sp.]
MRHVIPILFYLLSVIHILPALSGLSGTRFGKLYGVATEDSTLITLLQHRAVLFGFVGAACIYAAHSPAIRWPVLMGTIISMASFIVIAAMRGTLSGALNKIVIVDAVGLLIAAILIFLMAKG